MTDSVSELLRACVFAYRNGSDFPTIWQEILKRHPAVVGAPVQGNNSEGPTLEVPLIAGRRLIFDRKGFSLA